LFLTDDVIEQAKKKGINTIDEFILVGGSSRMLQVSEAIKTKYGIEPKLQDPDGAVAKGAALYALGGFDPDPPVPDP
jgi:molecular chaperone DnaK (HSP70)